MKSKAPQKKSPKSKSDSQSPVPVKLSEVSALRQGLIVYIFAMAVVVAIGIYLYQRASTLNQQYEKIITTQAEKLK